MRRKRPLNVDDRTNHRAVAERLASGIFAPGDPWVRDGALHGVTQPMLASLLEAAVAIGFDCGVLVERARSKS